MMDGNDETDEYDTDKENKGTKAKQTSSGKNARHRAQKFCKAWLQCEDFKFWLLPVPNNKFKAKCKICGDNEFTAELSVIRKHAKRKCHVMKTNQLLKHQKQMQSFLARSTKMQETSQQKLTKVAEIKLCGFLAEHNISFRAIDHLSELIKTCFPDSKIAKKMQLKRTKSTNIIKHVIGSSEKDILTEKLKKTPFSILTDESTDICNEINCIYITPIEFVCNKLYVSRFYDAEIGAIVSRFWELAQLFKNSEEAAEGATSERLFHTIMTSFEKRNIPKSNIVGFASDGCNTMVGKHNSVASRFRELCPGITIYKCICHSLHLCASEACKALPRTCEDLARNVYNFFKASAKRQSDFIRFQFLLNLKIHRLLHPSQTRWLSVLAVVSRLLEQWEGLKLYFAEKLVSEKLLSVEQIYNALNDPLIHLFYLFLEWVLPKFVTLNRYFQSDKVVIVNLYSKMKVAYTDILCSYMDRMYVLQTRLADLDPTNESKYINVQSMYLGVKVMTALSSEKLRDQPPDLRNHFFEGCRRFLITSCIELKKRFDFKDPVLPLLESFTPIKAMSQNYRTHRPSLLPIMTLMPRVVHENSYQKIDDEWRQLPFFTLPGDINSDDNADIFWSKILKIKNEEVGVFSNLAKFVLDALVVPHSNAECERVFSKVNLCKTKVRNKLITDSIEGLLLTSQHLNKDCIKFEPTKNMLAKMTTATLYPQTPQSNQSTEDSENDDVMLGDDDN
ncbi:PREDICTED: uncharacterized protein LOC105555964 [Vollenhovia emeryi]|uniref:uncharacterized protein LOC105555964 n=1 Tax=Vollenhovia emeryi TaxID=411798 RepID=UPI0005F50F1E|nr:PREDICTED: uncharacterized protein LOC105555964 [Vollenhovia emeryi]